MRLTRSLLLTTIVGFTALVVLQFTLSSVNQAAMPVGCSPKSADGEFDPGETVAFWNNQESLIAPPVISQIEDNTAPVLGDNTSEKWIEVDLSDQKLIAHQGDTIFLETLISSGIGNRTPVGEYQIWYKIASTKMEGGNKLNKTYYYLPNVPYTMFFKGDYGIHGTYWHNNFGHRMSHGCVNAPTDMAKQLFYWTNPQLPEGKRLVKATPENPGTRVVIHD